MTRPGFVSSRRKAVWIAAILLGLALGVMLALRSPTGDTTANGNHRAAVDVEPAAPVGTSGPTLAGHPSATAHVPAAPGEPMIALRVLVQDDGAGTGLPGADVRVYASAEIDALGLPVRAPAARAAITDADGFATVASPDPRLIAVRAVGYLAGFHVPALGATTITLKLVKTLPLQVTIRSTWGAVVPGLPLRLVRAGAGPGMRAPFGSMDALARETSVRTDARGMVTIPVPVSGSQLLMLDDPDWIPVDARARKGPWVPGWRLSHEAAPIDLQVAPLRFVRAIVSVRGQGPYQGTPQSSLVLQAGVTGIDMNEWPHRRCADGTSSNLTASPAEHYDFVHLDFDPPPDARVQGAIEILGCHGATPKLRLWKPSTLCSADQVDLVEMVPKVEREVGSLRVYAAAHDPDPRRPLRSLYLTYDEPLVGALGMWGATGLRQHDGSFLFGGIPAGQRTVHVSGGGSAVTDDVEVTVEVGRVVDIRAVLPALQGVSVRLTGKDGVQMESVDRIRVRCESDSKRNRPLGARPALLGELDPSSGEFHPHHFHLAVGTYRVLVQMDGKSFATSESFVITPGVVVELALTEGVM